MSGHKYPTTPQNIGQAMVRRIWKNVSTCVTQHMAENMTIYIYIYLFNYIQIYIMPENMSGRVRNYGSILIYIYMVVNVRNCVRILTNIVVSLWGSVKLK